VSIDQQIADIEALAAIDAAVKALTVKLESEKGDIDGVRTEVAELEERIKTDTEGIQDMEKTRGDLLGELRTMIGQIDRSRDRLNRARNERESNAAERELDELRKIQRDRDDEVKKIVTLVEEARAGMQLCEDRKKELEERLEGSIEGSTKIIDDLQASIDGQQSGREALVKKLPSLLYRRYSAMLKRGKQPIAKSHDGTCLGCFVQLQPMLFHRMLSRTEFTECPFCHRILYYAPKPTEEPPAEVETKESAAADSPAGDKSADDTAGQPSS
jgi:predicted  nucleic acid-binding Zn-ribbon protein